MPNYSIQGPDGRTYSIEGPTGATREQVIAEIQRQNGGKIGAKPSMARDVGMSGGTGVLKGAANLLRMGELATPMGMAKNTLNALGVQTPMSAGQTSQNAIAQYGHKPETRAGRYAESIGENVVNALAPGGPIARVASVVLPGVMGEGAREAAESAGMGETGQAVAKAAGGIAGGVATAVRPNRFAEMAAQPKAGPVNKLAARAKADPEVMSAKAAEMRAAGVDPTLVDLVGPRGRRVLRAVGVKREGAGQVLTENARTVSSSAKPAIMDRTSRVGPMQGKTADELSQEIDAARGASAQKNYAEPYATPVTVPDTVMDMLADSAGRSIIARARADAVERQDWMQQAELDKLLQLPDKGGVGPLPRVSAGTIDRLVIAARERGNKFMERGNRMRAGGSYQRQEQLDSVLNDVEEIKPARQDYRNKSMAIDVLGAKRQDVFSTDPADYGRWLQGLSPEAREANKVAIRQEVLDTLGGQRSATFGTVDELATSQYAQQNLRQALGPEADRYLAYLTNKLDQVRNARFVDSEAGSRTAVVENDLGGVIRGAAGAAVDAKTGNWANLAARGADFLKSRGINDRDAEALVRMAVDPAQTDRAIQIIGQRLGPDAAKSAIEWRRAALVALSSGASAMPPSAAQAAQQGYSAR